MIPRPRFVCGVLVAFAALVLGTAGAPAQEGPTLFGGIGGQDTVSDLLVLDPATGAVVDSAGSTGFGITGLAIHPLDGELYGVTTAPSGDPRFLVRIDRATGAAAPVGALGGVVADITFTPEGTLYGWSESSDDLVTIDLVTGAMTVVGESGISSSGSGLAYDAANDRLLLAPQSGVGALFIVDRATGVVTELSTLNGPSVQVAALTFACDGTLYATLIDISSPARPTDLATIDPESGEVSVVGDTEEGLDAIVFDCPEPLPPGPPAPPAPEPAAIQPTFTG